MAAGYVGLGRGSPLEEVSVPWKRSASLGLASSTQSPPLHPPWDLGRWRAGAGDSSMPGRGSRPQAYGGQRDVPSGAGLHAPSRGCGPHVKPQPQGPALHNPLIRLHGPDALCFGTELACGVAFVPFTKAAWAPSLHTWTLSSSFWLALPCLAGG